MVRSFVDNDENYHIMNISIKKMTRITSFSFIAKFLRLFSLLIEINFFNNRFSNDENTVSKIIQTNHRPDLHL